MSSVVLAQTINSVSESLLKQSFVEKAEVAIASNDWATAETCLLEALRERPDDLNARFKLGFVYQSSQQLESALAAYRSINDIDPEIPAVHNNLGNVLNDLGRHADAIDSFARTLELSADYADGHGNLGNVLFKLGRLPEAEKSFRRAVELNPEYFGAWYNLANVLQGLQKFEEAVVCYRQAARLNPQFPGVQNNLGNTLRTIGRFSEAVAVFQRAIELQPDVAEPYSNLGGVQSDAGDLAAAKVSYLKALEVDPECVSAFSNLLYLMNYESSEPTTELYEKSREWGRRFAKPQSSAATRAPLAGKRRIRVGFVSPDFRQHSVAFFFEALVDGYDRERFEFTCYSNVLVEDHVSERLRSKTDHWRSIVGIDDRTAAELIRDDQVDILVDLAGHTGGNRLSMFAHRPAPVQVTWLGYPNTTGVSTIDFRLTDEVADPKSADEIHTETLVRLRDGFLCYRPDESAPDVALPPSIENGYLTFGSFNNITKVTPDVVMAWSDVIKHFDNSRLYLKSKLLEEESVRKNLIKRFVENGIAQERLLFAGRVDSYHDHLACYHKVDLALDTFPYNGTTTTCEALWMGVPVIVPSGRTHRSRVSQSILSRVGLHNAVARTSDDIASVVASLTDCPEELASLRAGLREAMRDSPLCQPARFAESVQSAFVDMIGQ